MIHDWRKFGLSRQDFIKYKGYFFRILEEAGVQESKDTSVKQKHDKSFKNILMEKNEMSKFLQQFLEINVETDELEEQKNNYINKQFEKRESDIIYKINNKEIYILVEHQSRVDKRMPRRIFEYCMGIMMAIEKSRLRDDSSNPIIIPIVIYTGKEKWTVNTNFSDTQKSYKGYENYKINLSYKLIDINKYDKENLVEKDTKLAYMMALEKCKTQEELKAQIIELILLAKDKETIEWIKQIITYVFSEELGENKDKILNILEKGELNGMEGLLERVKEREAIYRRELIKQGGIQNMLKVIKNMLLQNEDEEKIMLYTDAKKKDIQKVKKQLKMI